MKTPSDLHAMLTKKVHGTNAPTVHRTVTKGSSHSLDSSTAEEAGGSALLSSESLASCSALPEEPRFEISEDMASRLQHTAGFRKIDAV